MPEALFITGPETCAIRPCTEGKGDVLIRTLFSGVSRGTERLVFQNRVPEAEWDRMRAPFQAGNFPGPVKYGYCAVGEVIEGPAELLGRHVFALHPHQTSFRIPAAAARPLPKGLPPLRATLAANMETALNALWDARLSPGDRVAVIGGGVVGCLVARLASRTPACDVVLIDQLDDRAATANELCVTFARTDEMVEGCDVAFHCSASAGGLAKALSCLGREGRLIELSWYGAGEVAAPLGGAFHSQRLTIQSSQVGAIPAHRAARWDFARRMEVALKLLDDPVLDGLIGLRVPFSEAETRYPDLLSGDHVAGVFTYD